MITIINNGWRDENIINTYILIILLNFLVSIPKSVKPGADHSTRNYLQLFSYTLGQEGGQSLKLIKGQSDHFWNFEIGVEKAILNL